MMIFTYLIAHVYGRHMVISDKVPAHIVVHNLAVTHSYHMHSTVTQVGFVLFFRKDTRMAKSAISTNNAVYMYLTNKEA